MQFFSATRTGTVRMQSLPSYVDDLIWQQQDLLLFVGNRSRCGRHGRFLWLNSVSGFRSSIQRENDFFARCSTPIGLSSSRQNSVGGSFVQRQPWLSLLDIR
jgi:hypothetical protein